jgi:hypothetical protein
MNNANIKFGSEIINAQKKKKKKSTFINKMNIDKKRRRRRKNHPFATQIPRILYYKKIARLHLFGYLYQKRYI